jgi:hypothetical protein
MGIGAALAAAAVTAASTAYQKKEQDDAAAAARKQEKETQDAMRAQQQLEADKSAENITQTASAGSANASAAEITGAQKKRRAGAISQSLGI